MATIKDLLSSMISKINSKVSTWEELPDKPFGTKVETVEIVPPIDFINADESSIPDWIINGIGFEKGKMYTVHINNTKYNCNADDIYDDEGEIYFGVGIGGLNDDEPFSIIDFKNEELKEAVNGGMTCGIQFAEHLYASDKLVISISTEQETVTKIPQKYLPEHLQFGVKTEMVEIVPEQSVIAQAVEGETGAGAELVGSMNLKADAEYIVLFNGTKFICKPFELMPKHYMIGNAALVGGEGGNNEPFVMTGNETSAMMLVEQAGEYTVSVIEKTETLKRIDVMYLPEGSPWMRVDRIEEIAPTKKYYSQGGLSSGKYSRRIENVPYVLEADCAYELTISSSNATAKKYDVVSVSYNNGVRIEINDTETGNSVSFFYLPSGNYLNVQWSEGYNGDITFSISKKYITYNLIDIRLLPIEELKQALGLGGPV